MSAGGDRTAGLRAARAHDSADKRGRVRDAIDALEAAGTPITAAAVARSAGVSTWLVYTNGLREHLDAARRRQQRRAVNSINAAAEHPRPEPASVRTDLALARDQIRRLRAERDKLHQRLRLRLGAELDGPDRAELITRVADLENLTRQLLADRDARAAEATDARRRITELEDDLTAARESLRQVIKNQNRNQP